MRTVCTTVLFYPIGDWQQGVLPLPSAQSRIFNVDDRRGPELGPKPGSNYRQLFVNGRIRAEILYRETVGQEPLTPEEVAREITFAS